MDIYLCARSGSWLSTTFSLDISNEYSQDQTVRQISYYNSYVDRVSMSGPAREKTSLNIGTKYDIVSLTLFLPAPELLALLLVPCITLPLVTITYIDMETHTNMSR